MTLPTFQPQNPAINHYALGWASCTAYSGAMAAAFDQQKALVMTGEQLRRATHDTSGGLTLAQIDSALLEGWQINLATTYRLAWSDFAKKINAGCAAVLALGYGPIAASRFDAGRGFRGNHAIAVLPGWVGMDPLADGRYGEAYKYKGEAYPQQLLRTAAGKLDLTGSGSLLGDGLVYASFTKDNVHTFRLNFGTTAFWVYSLGPDGRITSRHARRFPRPTNAPCTGPRPYIWPGVGSRTLVQVTAGVLANEYVQIPQQSVRLEVVP